VPAGVTCIRNSITRTGPFLTADDLDSSDCGGTDPIDSGSRTGAIDIGFTVNFFGTSYSNLYLNTNGGVLFDNPSNRYDVSLTNYAVTQQTSLISPMTVDLYYDVDESNMWIARTVISGKKAFVVSWEEFDECCTSSSPDDEAASFQFVFIDNGSGNFIAYFNYDKFVSIDEGYRLTFDVDLRNGVTIGSNVVSVPFTHPLEPGQCVEVSGSSFGPGIVDDSAWLDNANYVKLHSERKLSVWQDSACTVRNDIAALQTSDFEYAALRPVFSPSPNAAAVGWVSYNSSNGATDVTELFGNVDISTLFDNGSAEIVSYSLNTSVRGRAVIGMSGGQTVTENVADPQETPLNPQVRSDRLPFFDQQGKVLGASEGSVVLTGYRLYCTSEIKINGSPASFSHTAMPAGDGRAKLEISLPTLEPGYHQLSMDTCGGLVTYDRFLFVPKSPAILEGSISNSLERASLIGVLRKWARENRTDYNSVECTVNARSLSQENAKSLARDLCAKTFALLADPKSYVLTVRENSSHVKIWYRVTLTNQ